MQEYLRGLNLEGVTVERTPPEEQELPVVLREAEAGDVGIEEDSHLIRSSLHELEAALDPSRFRRIHRSTIVSLAEVAEITSDGHGSYEVHLRSNRCCA